MVELALAFAVTLAPAASGIGQGAGPILARVAATVSVPAPAVACKPERPTGRGWIGTPPKTTGYRSW